METVELDPNDIPSVFIIFKSGIKPELNDVSKY